MEKVKNKFMKLLAIQTELNVPKSQNPNVQYWSRSKEDILASVKPLLLREKAIINLSDEIAIKGDSKTMVTTARIICAETGEEILSSVGYCDFIPSSKFMDSAKVSGACSSYAGKYALCNLLGVDGQSDHDYIVPVQRQQPKQQQQQSELLEVVIGLAKERTERMEYIVSIAKVETIEDVRAGMLSEKMLNALAKNWGNKNV